MQAIIIVFSHLHNQVFCMHVGWRPAFTFYNKWIALFGAAVCVAIMFVIRWYYALVTFVIVLILYKIVDFLKPGE